jgi:hypothetical protein
MHQYGKSNCKRRLEGKDKEERKSTTQKHSDNLREGLHIFERERVHSSNHP